VSLFSGDGVTPDVLLSLGAVTVSEVPLLSVTASDVAGEVTVVAASLSVSGSEVSGELSL